MARLRQLVVVLPGIGGSELVGPETGGPDGYDLTVSGLSRVWSAGRLDIGRVLEPTRLVSGLTILPPLLTLPGYRRVQQRLWNVFDRAVIDTYRPGRVDPDVDVCCWWPTTSVVRWPTRRCGCRRRLRKHCRIGRRALVESLW